MISGSQFRLPTASVPPGLAFGLVSTRINLSFAFSAPTTPSFSISSALFSKHSHLIENKRKSRIIKSFIFRQFRTLLCSSPGSPLLSVRSPKHTGGVPPSLSSRRLVSYAARLVRAPHPQCSPRGAKQLSQGRKPRVHIPITSEPQRGGTSSDFEFRPKSRAQSFHAPDFSRVDHLGTARQSLACRAFRGTTKSRRMDSYQACRAGPTRRPVGGT
jgi:hypothetical protein